MAYTTCLFLRIEDLERTSSLPYRACWQLYDQEGQLIATGAAPLPLDQIARDIPPAAQKNAPRIIVLLPAQSVLITAASLGKQSRDLQKMTKAIAYAVEDRLAEAAEEVHSAAGGPASAQGSAASVAIIRNAWMQKLIQELEAAELLPDVVTSEALFLPCEAGKAFAVMEDGHILFRFSETVASRLELPTFMAFLEHYLAEGRLSIIASQPLHTLELWTVGKDPAFLPSVQEPIQALCHLHGITLAPRQSDTPLFDWLCQRWTTEAPGTEPVNLLQGPYQGRSAGSGFPRLKAVAAVLAIWFVLQVAFYMGSTWYLNTQAQQLHAQSVAVYQRLFPADARIVDIKAQFAQHIAAASGERPDSFMPLLSLLAEGMTQAHHPDIQMLQYDGAKSELVSDMIATDFSSLDAFKHLDANVEISSAIKEENGVRGQVHISSNRKEKHG